MPKILVNTELVSAALKPVATTLKAAVVVSAAAVLSQAKGDLEANAAAAVTHLDEFSQKLHAVRNGMLQQNAVASAIISNAHTAEIDVDALHEKIGTVDDQVEGTKEALFEIVGSAERDGLDVFAERVGALGRALQDVMALAAGDRLAAAPPFMFDQFFLETMHDLSQRDWSAPDEA
ncbi:hypothetical protein V1281_003106 [Nitrobacteraceae bacterium AZCC 2161]